MSTFEIDAADSGAKCFSRAGAVFSLYFALLSFEFVAIVSGVSVGRVAAVLVLCAFLPSLKFMRLRFEPIDWLIGAFGFVSLISIYFYPSGNIEYGPYLTVALNLAIVVVGRSCSFDNVDLELWKKCLIASAVVLGIAAIVSPGQVGTEWVSGRVVPNIAGSQQDPNEFCGYYLLPMSYFLIRMFNKRNVLYGVPLLFFAYTVLMTGSRGGLLAFAVSFIAALFFSVRNDKQKVLICGVAALVLLIIVLNFDFVLSMLPTEIASRFIPSGANVGSAGTRISIWQELLSSYSSSTLPEQLFGHGFGATVLANSEQLVAHNVYIELLYDVGILGLFAFLALCTAGLIRAWRRKDFILVSALVGEAVLLLSLSSFWSKTLWGLLLLAFAETERDV